MDRRILSLRPVSWLTFTIFVAARLYLLHQRESIPWLRPEVKVQRRSFFPSVYKVGSPPVCSFLCTFTPQVPSNLPSSLHPSSDVQGTRDTVDLSPCPYLTSSCPPGTRVPLPPSPFWDVGSSGVPLGTVFAKTGRYIFLGWKRRK